MDSVCKEGELNDSNESCVLQICSGQVWRYICAKPNQWSENEAKVACYQMKMVWKEGSGTIVVVISLIICLISTQT